MAWLRQNNAFLTLKSTGWWLAELPWGVSAWGSSAEAALDTLYDCVLSSVRVRVWRAFIADQFEWGATNDCFFWFPTGNRQALQDGFLTLDALFFSIYEALALHE